MVDFINLLPYNLANVLMDWYSTKFSVCFSGVPGPTLGWKYDGLQAHSMSGVLPAMNDFNIFYATLNNHIHVTMVML